MLRASIGAAWQPKQIGDQHAVETPEVRMVQNIVELQVEHSRCTFGESHFRRRTRRRAVHHHREVRRHRHREVHHHHRRRDHVVLLLRGHHRLVRLLRGHRSYHPAGRLQGRHHLASRQLDRLGPLHGLSVRRWDRLCPRPPPACAFWSRLGGTLVACLHLRLLVHEHQGSFRRAGRS